MVQLTERGGWRVARGARAWCGALCVACAASVGGAQEGTPTTPSRFNLDKLELTSLGLSLGTILPSQVEPTKIYALQADYGQVAPGWHLVFGVSYWESRFRDAVVQGFVDSLQQSVADPTGTAKITPSRVTLYDIAFGADARYTPVYSGELKPFVGAGLAAHVINAEGKLINGTFVERALDDIAAGMFVTAGLSFKLLNHIGVEGSLRGDLLSGFRSTQLRVGGIYYFGHIRGLKTGGARDHAR